MSRAATRQILSELLPPRLYRALRGLRARHGARLETFAVEHWRASVEGQTHLVPAAAAHRPACRAVLSGRRHEPATHALVAALMRRMPGDMVHAGAFFGDMLQSFARACPGTVYAFEPVLESYLLARLSLDRAGPGNVVLLHAGLGARFGAAAMRTRDDRGVALGGGARVAAAGDPREAGEGTVLLDLDRLGLDGLTLLQLDLEGHELPALEGAARTIRACRPAILVEDNAGTCGGWLAAEGYAPRGEVPGLALWTDAARADAAAAALAEAGGTRIAEAAI